MSLRPTKEALTSSVGRTFAFEQASIFDLPPASRLTDPITSKIAAKRFEGKTLSALHLSILEAIRLHGSLTDESLERMPAFSGYAPSTVRKRRSELFALWRLVEHGLMTNSRGLPMVVWSLPKWDAAEAARRFKDLGKQELRRESA